MIVAVGSWRGIGSTTTALLLASCLAAREETSAWLIEADPAGGALAGRMQLAGHSVGGLERVAFPNERLNPADALASSAHETASLHIVTAPADPFRAHACHQPRLPWVSSLRDLTGEVIVDVGRLRGGAPTWPILILADVVLLVASPEVSASVSTNEWLQACGRVSPSDAELPPHKTQLVFVDSPSGVAFPRATLGDELGEQFAGWFPWEPATVDLIHRGAATDDRRLRRSALISAAKHLAAELTSKERVSA